MIVICWMIQIPVCQAFYDYSLRFTALRKGRRDGILRVEATTEKARAVVFLTYSSAWSISGHTVEIMWVRPVAFERLQIISQPSTQV